MGAGLLKWLNEAYASKNVTKLAMNIANLPVVAQLVTQSSLSISLRNLGILCQQMCLRVTGPPHEDVIMRI